MEASATVSSGRMPETDMRKAAPSIDMDWDRFQPFRTQELTHSLAGHPLLRPDRLAQLGSRLEGLAQIYSFNNSTRPSENFRTAGRKNPNPKGAAETILGIGEAQAWILLRHVQTDPEYRGLVDGLFDSIEETIGVRDPGIYFRAAWIFVSSPNTTTPFHIDRNHGLLLQLSGHKTVYAWQPDDTVAVSDEARSHFLRRRSLELVRWREELRPRAQAFAVRPGSGVYLPATAPHLVETSNEPSITMSLSYNTRASRRAGLLHAAHGLVRRVGVQPPPVGRYPAVDALASAGAESLVRTGAGKWLGMAREDACRAAYAPRD